MTFLGELAVYLVKVSQELTSTMIIVQSLAQLAYLIFKLGI
jgi:hypothetical protein